MVLGVILNHSTGVTTDIHWLLKDRLNFTPVFTKANQYGIYDMETQTATGVVKLIVDGTVDLGALLAPTPARTEVITIIPVLSARIVLFSKIPEMTSKSCNYTEVFSNDYWMTLIVTGLIITLILFLLSRYFDVERSQSSLDLSFSISLPLRALIAVDVQPAMSQKGNKRVSYRLAVFCTLILGTMNFFFFNSSLISHLTVRENHKVIEMFTDLQTDDKNQLFIVKGQAVEDLLRSSENSVYAKVWKKYFHNDSRRLLNSINELEAKLLESEHNYGCAVESDVLFQVKEYPCIIRTAKVAIQMTHVGLPIATDSPYLPLFQHHISAILESGTFDRLQRMRVANASLSCYKSDANKSLVDGIGFGTTHRAFLYLVVGLALALSVAVAEQFIVVCIGKGVSKPWTKYEVRY